MNELMDGWVDRKKDGIDRGEEGRFEWQVNINCRRLCLTVCADQLRLNRSIIQSCTPANMLMNETKSPGSVSNSLQFQICQQPTSP